MAKRRILTEDLHPIWVEEGEDKTPMTTNNKKQRFDALGHLAKHFDEVNESKTPTDKFGITLAKSILALPLNEQDLALDILRTIPGIGELLSNLQQRNGYDTDNKAALQLRGHA